ncbi:MAG: oxygenase MpaB family protein [Acidimicrobiales bacterium]
MGSKAGIFGPSSVAWRVHADPSMLVGGLRALLIQATNPLAMAGVDQHSDYLVDPWGRLRRTTEFVMTATFGTRDEAEALGAIVRRVHENVRGVDPWTGRHYSASDPELLAWVHNVLVHSFLTAYRRYGGSLSRSEMDRYVGEMVGMAALVGLAPGDVPHDVAGLRAYVRDAGPLQVTPAARRGVKTILAPPMPLALRPVWAVPAVAAISLLPARVRSLYGFLWFPPVEPGVRITTSALVRSLRLVLPDPPPIRSARARLAA